MTGTIAPSSKTAMLTVQDVADLLKCSRRTVSRLADSGQMPRPVKIGSLARWNREVVERWIAQGCPAQKGGEL